MGKTEIPMAILKSSFPPSPGTEIRERRKGMTLIEQKELESHKKSMTLIEQKELEEKR